MFQLRKCLLLLSVYQSVHFSSLLALHLTSCIALTINLSVCCREQVPKDFYCGRKFLEFALILLWRRLLLISILAHFQSLGLCLGNSSRA